MQLLSRIQELKSMQAVAKVIHDDSDEIEPDDIEIEVEVEVYQDVYKDKKEVTNEHEEGEI
jgi:hypothetical protein